MSSEVEYDGNCVQCVAERSLARIADGPSQGAAVAGFESAYLLGVAEQSLRIISRPRSYKPCARHRAPRVRRSAHV